MYVTFILINSYHGRTHFTYYVQLGHGWLMTCISNYTHSFQWDIITLPHPNFNIGLTKPPLKLGFGGNYLITLLYMDVIINIRILMLIWLKSANKRGPIYITTSRNTTNIPCMTLTSSRESRVPFSKFTGLTPRADKMTVTYLRGYKYPCHTVPNQCKNSYEFLHKVYPVITRLGTDIRRAYYFFLTKKSVLGLSFVTPRV